MRTASDSKKPQEPRISAEESKEVLSELDSATQPPPTATYNRRLRVPYGSRKIEIEIDEGMGRKTGFVVQGRNLSTMGLAVLHAQFIHTGRVCTVKLPTLNGRSMVSMKGTVRRCRLVRGRTHEIAIAFEKPIELTEFVALSGTHRREYRSEVGEATSAAPSGAAVTPKPLTCANVLVLADFEVSRDLYKLMLTRIGLTPLVSGSLPQAVKVLAETRVDVILMDLNQGDGGNELRLVKALRAQKLAIPVICITADGSDSRRCAAMDAGCADVLVKPVEVEDLSLAIQASMTDDPFSPLNRTPIRTSMNVEPELLPLLQKFADQARTLSDMLRAAMEDSNRPEMEKICRRLADTGKNFGFAPVAEVGRAALQSIQQDTSNAARVRSEIERVIAVLNRIEV